MRALGKSYGILVAFLRKIVSGTWRRIFHVLHTLRPWRILQPIFYRVPS
jgi:hypothetical protein